MPFSILFQSAGDGSPESVEYVRQGLIEQLRIPAETVSQMLDHAPLVVKRGLTEEQAKAFGRALESVGAVIRILPPEASPEMHQTGQPEPVAEDTDTDWWHWLNVFSPPFAPELRGVSPMSATGVFLNGDTMTLGHPLIAGTAFTDILLATVFRTNADRWFLDLYCRNQARPARIDADVVNYESFGIPAGSDRSEAVLHLVCFLIQKSPETAIDLATFRFLRDPHGIRTLPNERAADAYVARLTADILTPETRRQHQYLMSGSEAELYREANDPWSGAGPPSLPPGVEPGTPIYPPPGVQTYQQPPAPPMYGGTSGNFTPPPVQGPYYPPPPGTQTYQQPPVPPMYGGTSGNFTPPPVQGSYYPPPPGTQTYQQPPAPPMYGGTSGTYAPPPVQMPVYPPPPGAQTYQPPPPMYATGGEFAAPPVQKEAYPPPLPGFVPPPLSGPPPRENYWSNTGDTWNVLPRVCIWMVIFFDGLFLLMEMAYVGKVSAGGLIILSRLASIGLYVTSNLLISQQDRKAGLFYLAGLFLDIISFSLGGSFLPLLPAGVFSTFVFFWVFRESME